MRSSLVCTSCCISVYFTFPAKAFVLLRDEYFPRAQLSERVLQRETGFLSAQMLSGAGQDTVEALVNEQRETRLFAALGVSAQTALSPIEKLRVDLSAHALRAVAQSEVSGSSDWKKDESRSELVTSGFARLLLNEGLRIGAGAQWVLRPASEESFAFAGETGKTSFAAFNFFAPEYILSKESSSGWSIGMAWRPQASRQRSLVRVAASEQVELQEDVELDEQWSAGLRAEMFGGRELNLDFQLSTLGDPSKNDAASAAEYSAGARRRYGISGVLGGADWAGHNLSFGLGYLSLGYTDQGQVSPNTIPMWTVLIRDKFKWSDLNAHFDALVGLGKDKQSLPDLNADYRRVLFSVQTGLTF